MDAQSKIVHHIFEEGSGEKREFLQARGGQIFCINVCKMFLCKKIYAPIPNHYCYTLQKFYMLNSFAHLYPSDTPTHQKIVWIRFAHWLWAKFVLLKVQS